ncbi:MAG: ribonuclease HI family protein [Candidatus Hydrogenedentota bacterium]
MNRREIIEELKKIKNKDNIDEIKIGIQGLIDNLEAIKGSVVSLYSDGTALENNGPGAAAFILKDETGKTIFKKGIYISEKTTNNVAEYRALLEGLNFLIGNGFRKVKIYSDSSLVINQLKGNYKIRDQRLAKFAIEIMNKLKSMDYYELINIPRDQNKEADTLAVTVVNLKQDIE